MPHHRRRRVVRTPLLQRGGRHRRWGRVAGASGAAGGLLLGVRRRGKGELELRVRRLVALGADMGREALVEAHRGGRLVRGSAAAVEGVEGAGRGGGAGELTGGFAGGVALLLLVVVVVVGGFLLLFLGKLGSREPVRPVVVVAPLAFFVCALV